MKIIGLDVGTVRIGVAYAETKTKIAVPDGYINVNGQEVSEISRRLRLHGSNILIIGLPRSNQGTETAQSDFVKKFTNRLAATLPGLKIYFQDESLTSVEAEKRLKSRKRRYQKGEIDAEAASIILQDFIEHLQSTLHSQQTLIPEQFSSSQFQKPPALTQGNVPALISESSSAMPHQASNSKKSKTKRSFVSKLLKVLIILILTSGVASGALYYWYHQELRAPQQAHCSHQPSSTSSSEEISNPACKYQKFEIKPNETIDTIAQNLQKQGLIRSDLVFKIYLKITNKSAKIKAGDYQFRPSQTTQEIASELENGVASKDVFNLTILPGETINEIKTKLQKLGYRAEQVDAALVKKYDFPILKGLYDESGKLKNPAQPNLVALEGYLFGETYQFYQGETVERIFETILKHLSSTLAHHQIEEKLQKKGLSLREGIILASIIQKEAHTEDMPGVSMVFQNRLRIGMSLGSDVTSTYAADLVNPNRNKSDPNNNLRVLETDNLYNTRKHTGLPPGPICSPSLSALLAVVNPDENKRSMYYFLTGDDGKMYYSVTDTEHEQKKRDFCKKLCNVGL